MRVIILYTLAIAVDLARLAAIAAVGVAAAWVLMQICGCSQHPPVIRNGGAPQVAVALPVGVGADLNLSLAEHKAIIAARIYYNCALGGRVLASAEEHVWGGPIVMFVRGQDSGRQHAVTRTVTEDGRLHMAMVEMAPHLAGARTEWIDSIVRHELGHVLGLAHSIDRTSLMFSVWPTGEEHSSVHPIDLSESESGMLLELYGLSRPTYDTGACTANIWASMAAMERAAKGI